MTLENVETFAEVVSVGVCLFCANLLLLRRRDPGVYLPLALLFLFHGVGELVYLLLEANNDAGRISTYETIGFMFAGVLDVAKPFLFWLYVRALTTEGEVPRVPKLHYHIIPIVLIVLLIVPMAFIPTDLNTAKLPDDDPVMIRIALIILAVLIVDILFKIMVAIYLFLTIRRLRIYHRRLKDVFASTENRELTWIWLITISAAIYWLISIIVSVSIWGSVTNETTPNEVASLLHTLALLMLFWVLGIWGLRQRPGLVRSPVVDPPEPEDPPTQKYEKSALDDERAARIATKIKAAMENDLLYREPNLSLWDLAKHIGVTSHYVSQSLNTQLHSSFFDYINRWRIKDAVEQLTSTDETILRIAYDVGFNSRSAFYKAFKRETGKTPSDLRK